jgi:hypothetical protein
LHTTRPWSRYRPPPGTDRVGGPAVGEVFTELQDSDQGQPPGRQRGLASAGIELSEIGIGEEGAELVAQLEIRIAIGKGGTGDLGRVLGDG